MTNKKGLVYPEESYKIVGSAFNVFNKLGYGLREDYYKKASAKELEKAGLKYEREKIIRFSYDGDTIGKYFADFVVENKMVVELKARY